MNRVKEFKISRIVCAVNFNELSDLALKYAAAGAKAYNARLTVFHAVHFELPPYITSRQTVRLALQRKGVRRDAENFLREQTKTILGSGAEDLEITYQVTATQPVEGILAVLGRENADAVVLGTHGRSGPKRLWLGSVAEDIVRQVEIPVFVVRQKEHDFIDTSQPLAAPRLKSILCAVCCGEAGRAAIQVAASIAKRFDALLLPVCVPRAGEGKTSPAAEAELRSWVEDTFNTPCVVKPISQDGHPAAEIVALAEDRQADLVVLGMEPRTSIRDRLFGGMTELVMRHAPAPVLVIPGSLSF